jgi:hypothetical protein
MTIPHCLRFETPPTWRFRSPYIYIPQEQGGPVIAPGTGFPFRRLLRLAVLRWRYWNPPPRRDRLNSKSNSHCDWRSVSQSVSQSVSLSVGLMTRYYFLFYSYCPGAPSLTRRRHYIVPTRTAQRTSVPYCVFSRCRGNNVSTKLFPSNGCCTVACLHNCCLAMVIHVTIYFLSEQPYY